MKKDWKAPCQHCDECGGLVTYQNQVAMPLNGRVHGIDWCIHPIVAALNASNIRTMASCCGHQNMPGRISLEDGRELIVLPDGAMLYDILHNTSSSHSLWEILSSVLQRQQNCNRETSPGDTGAQG